GTTGLLAALLSSQRLGNFDVVYDPTQREQIQAGKVTERNGSLYFDSWTSFTARSQRLKSAPPDVDATERDYRIQATIQPDLSLTAVTRVTVRPLHRDLAAIAFDITPQMSVSAVNVDGQPAEVLQRESLRLDGGMGGNGVFLVAPPEPLRAG